MNSDSKESKDDIKLQNKKYKTNKSIISLQKLSRVKSVHIIKGNNWNERLINKMPENNSSKNKNFRINLSIKSYSGRKSYNKMNNNIISKNFNQYKINNGENSFNFLSLNSNKNSINGKNELKNASAKTRETGLNNDLKYMNIINLNDINKLWDDLCVAKHIGIYFQ